MEAEGLKYIGLGLATIPMFGAAIGVGNIFSALLNGIARNPSATPEMFTRALIGAGLAEAMGLFAFIIALLLLLFV